MPQKNDTADLKIFAVLGVIGLMLMIFGPAAWLTYRYMAQQPEISAPASPTTTKTMPSGPLGELDSTCGGPNRLPCRPGLKCSNGIDYAKTGVCEKDLAAAKSGVPVYRQLGEACRYAFPVSEDCAPGLVCLMANASSTPGTCIQPEKTSPQIIRVKLEGAEPASGQYLVSAKKGLSYTVETLNAETVRALWNPDKGSPGESKLSRKTGGTFVNPLKGEWKAGVAGTLTIRAFDKAGSFAILDYRLASQE